MNHYSAIDIAASRQLDDRREVWLLGQPSLGSYLDFVKEMALDVEGVEEARHVDQWRAANDYYGALEVSEADICETIECLDLPKRLRPLAAAVAADLRYARAFDTLPARFAMVELDKLIVGHPFLSESHKDRLAAKLGPKPSQEDVFRFCQPLDRDEAQVEMRALGSRQFLFWSPSSDFRFQEIRALRPDQTPGVRPGGTLAGLIGVMVGYSSNFLSLIQSDNRLLLHNGHHRAYALRSLGVTHAPCIIETVTRLDELKVVATRSVQDDPAFYFVSKRPPLLKDFFDPKIRRVHRVHPSANVIEVKIEVKEHKQIRDFSART